MVERLAGKASKEEEAREEIAEEAARGDDAEREAEAPEEREAPEPPTEVIQEIPVGPAEEASVEAPAEAIVIKYSEITRLTAAEHTCTNKRL